MDFAAWTRALHVRGFRVVPPSHAAPVRIWALLPAGDLLHFRCQGTMVRLERHAEDDVLFADPVGHCDCGCGRRLAAPQTPPRLVLRANARPVDVASFDGARIRGWRGHEAGLLSVAEAAPMFEELLADLGVAPRSASGHPRSGPVATGRFRSDTQSDQEPTYSAAGIPASSSASTSWAALTPDPQ